ncbi:MAG: GIY-YIG nuclease family protein [bacterium]|nr:GIY-YIG nuclease family protein [bacterium]
MYYLYILRKGDDKLYIGYTNDLKRRIAEHKGKLPELVYYEAYKDKLDAQDRERKLKQRGHGIKELKKRIENSLKKV